jgi:hypothetical protein
MIRTMLGPSFCVLVIFVGAALSSIPEANAQEAFRAWVALYDSQQTSWLENENRVNSGELCREASDFSECYSAMMRPYVSVHELRAEPDETSGVVGELIIVAVPGRGLSSHFRSSGSAGSVVFLPDLFLQDWGYGPYFHHTLSQKQGNWFQLPPDPWGEAVWIHLGQDSLDSSVISVTAGDIIDLNGAGMYVVSAAANSLTLRAEQPGDLWCEVGDPPPILPEVPERVLEGS